jgi:hypothetical protein
MTIKVVSSNPTHGKVYLIQHYVIKFISDLRKVSGFLHVLQFPPPIKWPPRYNWNIIESGVKHHNPNTVIYQYGEQVRVVILIRLARFTGEVWLLTSS